jgi:hypothetical protein
LEEFLSLYVLPPLDPFAIFNENSASPARFANPFVHSGERTKEKKRRKTSHMTRTRK